MKCLINWPSQVFQLTLATAISIASLQVHSMEKNAQPTITLPAALIGNWQVKEVHIDTGATRTLRYQHDDPRLIGRLFTIDRDKLTTNTPEDKSCIEPRVAIKHTTAAKLIADSMAGRGTFPDMPTPKDYALPLKGNTPVDAFTMICKNGVLAGGLGRDGGTGGAWMIALPVDTLAVRWYDETILVLGRVPENVKPNASFRCEKALTASEKTICRSIELAAFDSSVAQSYAGAVKQLKNTKNTDNLNLLYSQQKEWLTKRNACNSDANCLQKSMADRMEAIETMTQQ